MEGDAVKCLSESEIRDMLSSIACREVRNMWQEMEERLKLGMLNEIAALECESSCAVVRRKRDRIYDDDFKGRYSCIPDRGGKVERRGEGRDYARNAVVE